MVPLPPVAPQVGLTARVRLARDYYVRVDGCDYSVYPRVIGRFVEITAVATELVVGCVNQNWIWPTFRDRLGPVPGGVGVSWRGGHDCGVVRTRRGRTSAV